LSRLSGGRLSGATRSQLEIAPVTMNPLTVGASSVVVVENPSNGISLPLFDEAEDGRLLTTRRAKPLPGDEARAIGDSGL
jgi:hypothetical protein